MATIVVHVMPKPDLLDPQGKAVGFALPRLGFTGFSAVRQGKRLMATLQAGHRLEPLAQALRCQPASLRVYVAEELGRQLFEGRLSTRV